MGSSSSKPQYYYPQTGYPAQGDYTTSSQPQFGYYIQQVGAEPSQVQVIPGYYYHSQTGNRLVHKRHNSSPALSNPLPAPPRPAGPTSTTPPAAASETPADPPGEVAAPPEAPPEAPPTAPADAPADTKENPEPAQQPDVTAAPAPVPAPSESTNPLPSPPRDVLDLDQYRHIRRTQTSGSAGTWQYYAAPVASVSYKPHLRSQYRPKRKETLRLPRPHEELKAEEKRSGGGRNTAMKFLRSLTLPTLTTNKMKKPRRPFSLNPAMTYPYQPGSRGRIPTFPPGPISALSVSSGRPITIPLNSPLNPTSLHKILYKKKLYPTAAHLFEAQKFLKHNPELAERIRMSSNSAAEMSKLSGAFREAGMVRKDWELVWRDKMDEVLYMKFTQHPDLRAELMATGYAQLLDGNEIRQPDAEGVNELGKALTRLRERLRMEGAR